MARARVPITPSGTNPPWFQRPSIQHFRLVQKPPVVVSTSTRYSAIPSRSSGVLDILREVHRRSAAEEKFLLVHNLRLIVGTHFVSGDKEALGDVLQLEATREMQPSLEMHSVLGYASVHDTITSRLTVGYHDR